MASTMGTGSFPVVKRPGCGADHTPPPKCRGHERVGLYLYSPAGPQWPVIGRNFSGLSGRPNSFYLWRHLKEIFPKGFNTRNGRWGLTGGVMLTKRHTRGRAPGKHDITNFSHVFTLTGFVIILQIYFQY